jgi:hypothetical protein
VEKTLAKASLETASRFPLSHSPAAVSFPGLQTTTQMKEQLNGVAEA